MLKYEQRDKKVLVVVLFTTAGLSSTYAASTNPSSHLTVVHRTSNGF